jgi:hypothetical protein
MADAAGLTVTVNDPGGVQRFSASNYNQANDRIATQEQNRGYETDSVELSEESMNLSRSNGNLSSEEMINFENETLAESLQGGPTAIGSDLFATDAGGFTATIGEIGTESTVGLTASQIESSAVNNQGTVTNQLNTGTNNVSGPLREEGIRATGAETFLAQESVPIESQASVSEVTFTAASASTQAEIEADSIYRETGQGATIREDKDDYNRENPVSLEVQSAEAAARSNVVINNNNGITQAAPTPAADIAPENPRNQQNIVLQNVGTQIAQTVPPSSIISVLG